MPKYRYVGDVPAHLSTSEFSRDLAPGDEFESPVELNNANLQEVKEKPARPAKES